MQHNPDDAAPDGWRSVDDAALRRHLIGRLPVYMVPDHIALVARMPLLDNGKIDERRLEIPAFARQREVVAPTGPIETRIAEVWRELLELEEVGVTTSFFALGGQSLKAVRMIARVNEMAPVQVKLVDFYLEPTIVALARLDELPKQEEPHDA